MKVQARLNNYRRSAKKVRELQSLIKGLSVDEAELQLRFAKKGSALDLRKLLLSAVANARNNFNLEESDLTVSNLEIQEGRVMKRWRARAYGRAASILKRSCHVILTLETESKEEFKDPKSKKSDSRLKKTKETEKESKKNAKKQDKEKQENRESKTGKDEKDSVEEGKKKQESKSSK